MYFTLGVHLSVSMVLRTNSDYLRNQYQPAGVRNADRQFFLYDPETEVLHMAHEIRQSLAPQHGGRSSSPG